MDAKVYARNSYLDWLRVLGVMRFLFGMKRLLAVPLEGAVKPQLGGAAQAG